MLRPGQPGNDGSGPGAGCKQPLGGQGVPRSGRAARGWLGAAPMRGASMQGAAQGSYEPVGQKGAAWEGRGGVSRSLAGATTKPRVRPNPPEPAAPLPPLLQGLFVACTPRRCPRRSAAAAARHGGAPGQRARPGGTPSQRCRRQHPRRRGRQRQHARPQVRDGACAQGKCKCCSMHLHACASPPLPATCLSSWANERGFRGVPFTLPPYHLPCDITTSPWPAPWLLVPCSTSKTVTDTIIGEHEVGYCLKLLELLEIA